MKTPCRRLAACILVCGLLTMAGCGSSAPTATPTVDPSLPTVSVVGGFASLPPDTGGGSNVGQLSVSVRFTVTLSAPPNGIATVDYQAVNGTARGGGDYSKTANMLTFLPGETSKIVDVPVIGGGSRHPYSTPTDVTFYLVLSNPSANIALGTASAIGTIMYAPGLNDTGVLTCATASGDGLPCESTGAGTDQYPVQDAEFGRDAIAQAGLLTKIGGGAAGFDYTKLDINGKPLPDQSTDYAGTPWSCVRDNVTGLYWEVKTPPGTPGSLHDATITYTWYDTDQHTNGGSPGVQCTTTSACDTEAYVAAVNQLGYCGATNWRMPTTAELQSLVDYGRTGGAATDTAYFPNTQTGAWYWADSPSAAQAGDAWGVDFGSGGIVTNASSSPGYVRLVHNK